MSDHWGNAHQAESIEYTESTGQVTDVQTYLDLEAAAMTALFPTVAGTAEASKLARLGANRDLDYLDVAALKVNGVSATATVAQQTVQTVEHTFAETSGTGTYTGAVVVPAGATVQDVVWRNTVVWGNAASASLVIGDDDDVNGYVEATDIKAAPAADVNGAGGISTRLSLGATCGAYKGGGGKFCAGQKTITATVTTGVGTAATGRSRLLVTYAVPTTAAAAKA